MYIRARRNIGDSEAARIYARCKAAVPTLKDRQKLQVQVDERTAPVETAVIPRAKNAFDWPMRDFQVYKRVGDLFFLHKCLEPEGVRSEEEVVEYRQNILSPEQEEEHEGPEIFGDFAVPMLAALSMLDLEGQVLFDLGVGRASLTLAALRLGVSFSIGIDSSMARLDPRFSRRIRETAIDIWGSMGEEELFESCLRWGNGAFQVLGEHGYAGIVRAPLSDYGRYSDISLSSFRERQRPEETTEDFCLYYHDLERPPLSLTSLPEPTVAVANIGPAYGSADECARKWVDGIPSVKSFVLGGYQQNNPQLDFTKAGEDLSRKGWRVRNIPFRPPYVDKNKAFIALVATR